MKRATLILVALALLLGGVGQARAGYIITFSESNGNVVASGSGKLNITDLTYQSTPPATAPQMLSSQGVLVIGNTGVPDIYGESSQIMGPFSFGTGGFKFANSGSGDFVGLEARNGLPVLAVPTGYTSESPLTSSATWDNTTISGLGLTPGTHTWHWGTGPNADSLKVIVPGTPSVPEPSTLTLLGIGSLSLLGYGWRRRKRTLA